MSKHTPGEWKYEPRGAQVHADNPYGKDRMLVADIRGWGHLTGTGCGACKMSREDAEAIQDANGRLLAAAPRMLEMLQEVVVQYGGHELDELRAKIRALLKEVEG